MIRPVPKEGLIRDDAFRDWIRRRPCLLADREPCECGKYTHIGSNRQSVDCAHVRTKRLAGDVANCVPLCSGSGGHHMEQHRIGIKSFQAKYGLDLKATAAELWDRYREETGAET